MTLIIVCAVVGGLVAAALVVGDRNYRRRIAADQRDMLAGIAEEQAAMHRAYADRLIPRFATDGAPGERGRCSPPRRCSTARQAGIPPDDEPLGPLRGVVAR